MAQAVNFIPGFRFLRRRFSLNPADDLLSTKCTDATRRAALVYTLSTILTLSQLAVILVKREQ